MGAREEKMPGIKALKPDYRKIQGTGWVQEPNWYRARELLTRMMYSRALPSALGDLTGATPHPKLVGLFNPHARVNQPGTWASVSPLGKIIAFLIRGKGWDPEDLDSQGRVSVPSQVESLRISLEKKKALLRLEVQTPPLYYLHPLSFPLA